jgi:hypothetical protein
VRLGRLLWWQNEGDTMGRNYVSFDRNLVATRMAPIVSEAVEPIITGPSLKLPCCSIFGLSPHQMAHSAPDNRNAAFVLAPHLGGTFSMRRLI